MGCNTSKESVQPVEGEDKTETETETPAVENKTQENNTATSDSNKDKADTQDSKDQDKDKDSTKESVTKPSSASTVLALTPTESARSGERLSNHLAVSTPEPPPCDDEDAGVSLELDGSEEEAAAATKIQAVFRGHQTRRTMKQATSQQPQQEPEPTKEQLEAEFRADDKELCKAATTIQNSFRSHLKQKQDGGKEGEGSAAKEENKAGEDEEEELDIDLTDPELNKAATKIQASFRGHKVRKETETGSAPGH